jgi:hypothetical protein
MANQSHLDQGEGGVTRSRSRGSHLDQGPTGAGKKGASIPQKGGQIPANVPGNKGVTGSHLQPHPSLTNKTSERGGGTVVGHDRTNPNLGKSKSGSKNDQHPSLTHKSKQPSQKYLS